MSQNNNRLKIYSSESKSKIISIINVLILISLINIIINILLFLDYDIFLIKYELCNICVDDFLLPYILMIDMAITILILGSLIYFNLKLKERKRIKEKQAIDVTAKTKYKFTP